MEGGNDQPQPEDIDSGDDSRMNAQELISNLQIELDEVAKSGVDTKNSISILEQAKSAFNSNDLKTTFHYIELCKLEIIESKTRHQTALNKLKDAHEDLTEAKVAGLETAHHSQTLLDAEAALNKFDYSTVESLTDTVITELDKAHDKIHKDGDYKLRAEHILTTAKSHLVKAKDAGIMVPAAEALLTRSETALSTSNFEDSQQSSKDAIKLCREAKKIYAELQEQLEKAQTLIVNNKIFIDTTNAEKFLEQTKTKMSTGNYSEAIKSVTKVFNNITTLKQKKNPELTVKCPDSLIFKRDTWEKCPLEISNEGKVHASNVNLKLSDEIETRGISTIAKLAAGELKPLEFGIKSTKLGELPIELELTYTNPITAENLKFQGAMWLKVEPKSGEEDLTPDKIQRGIYAERATLSLSKRGDEYEIGFRTARGSGEACQISEFIKISPDTRDDVITKINDIVTMLNIFCRADEPSAQSEEAKAQEPSNAGLDISEKLGLKDKIQELSSLGELIYGTFLPVTVQQNLETIQEPLILNTNDNEIPWELLHDKTEFICLKVPIGRRLRSREVARVNPVIESDKIKILFIVNASGDLDSTEEEVAYIRQELTSEVDVDTLQDREATNAAILTALHSGAYDIIHYAGHAEFNLTSPDESALHVANKGKIYAQEIKRALGGKPLVFLNACSSGLEKLREGGGGYSGSDTEGLASSFLLGGALALIGASWPMPDVSAGLLASKFYEYFLNGESVGESLRKARLDFRAKRPEDVNWMAFILYGDPTLRLTRNITT